MRINQPSTSTSRNDWISQIIPQGDNNSRTYDINIMPIGPWANSSEGCADKHSDISNGWYYKKEIGTQSIYNKWTSFYKKSIYSDISNLTFDKHVYNLSNKGNLSRLPYNANIENTLIKASFINGSETNIPELTFKLTADSLDYPT